METLIAQTQERLQSNHFMHYTHQNVLSVEPDRAVCTMPVLPELCNPYGMLHGGALYALADDATGVAVHTDRRSYVTQGGTLHFLSNTGEGVVTAVGRVRHRGRTTCLAEVEITAEDGRLLATGEFTYFCVDLERMNGRVAPR